MVSLVCEKVTVKDSVDSTHNGRTIDHRTDL